MGTIRVVHAADLHIDAASRLGSTNPATGINTAWENTHRCWLAACEHAAEIAADAFVFAGDAFLNGRPGPEAVEMVADGFRLLSAAGVPAVVFRGNHELIRKPRGHRHALARLADIPGVTVVDDPDVVTLDSGLQIVVVPWPSVAAAAADLDLADVSPDDIDAAVAAAVVDRVDELAETVDPDRGPVMFAGHLTVSEARIGSAHRGSEQYVHAVFAEPVIPLDVLDDGPWGYAALGHIHRRQSFGRAAHYSGGMDRLDFSEVDEPKGVNVVTFTDTTSGGGTSGDGAASGDSGNSGVQVDLFVTPARPLVIIDAAVGPVDLPDGAICRVDLAEGETIVPPDIAAAVADVDGRVAAVRAAPAAVTRGETRAAVAEDVTVLDGLRAWMDVAEVPADDRPDLETAAQKLTDAAA